MQRIVHCVMAWRCAEMSLDWGGGQWHVLTLPQLASVACALYAAKFMQEREGYA